MDGQVSHSLLGLQVTEGPPSLNGAPSADVLEENGSQAFMTGLFFTPPPRYAICTCSYANLIFLPLSAQQLWSSHYVQGTSNINMTTEPQALGISV